MNKNDEISAARRKKRRKYNLKRLLWFTLALVMILVAVFVMNAVTKTTFLDIGDFVTTFFKTSRGYPVTLGEQAPLQVSRMSMAYAIVTSGELRAYSSGGAQLMAIHHGMLYPRINANSNRILLYNAGSRDISVYNRSNQITSFKTEFAIIDAKVADDGALAVLTESERYTCQLEVYRNGTYEKLLTWKAQRGFPLGAYISANSAYATAVRIVANDSVFYSLVTSLDVGKETERFEVELKGMALALYHEGDDVVVITDCAAYRLNRRGEMQTTYEFPEVPVLAVARDESANIAIAFGDNNQSAVNRIVLLQTNLKERSVIGDCGAVKDLYFTASRLYVLGERMVGEYNMGGKLLRRYETAFGTQAILDLNGLIAILPDRAERLKTPMKEVTEEA